MWVRGMEKSLGRGIEVPRGDATEDDGTIIAVEIPLVVLAFGTVVLRVYSRLGIKRKLALDDILIICAMVCALARTIISCMSAGDTYGFDRQGPELPTELPYYRHIFTRRLTYLLALLLTRLSILTYYIRIFPPQLPTLRLLSLLLILLSLTHFLLVLTLLSVLCHSIHLLWTPSWRTFHAPSCFSSPLYSYSASIGDSLVDTLIFLLPIPYVWRLSKLHARQRIGLIAVFGLGFLVCGVALAQNPFIQRRVNNRGYFGGAINLLVAVQVSIGIVAASLPDLRALGARWGEGFKPLHHRSWNTRGGLEAGGRVGSGGIGGGGGSAGAGGGAGEMAEVGISKRELRVKKGMRKPDWLRDSLPGSLMGSQLEEVAEPRAALSRAATRERPAMVRRPSLAVVDAVSKVLAKEIVELSRRPTA